MKYFVIIVVVLVISSCSYSVYSSGYPHLKTIMIQPFINNSTNYELDEIVFNSLSDYFNNDGRLKIVGLSPDCQLEGEILDYSNNIITYEGADVDEYEVRILFKVVFSDLKKNNVIWQNNTIALSETYSSVSTTSNYSTEEEAQKKIIKDLFDMILRESLEEW
ncbi:MAG: hypothetical protein K8R49_06010 [Candidatus Cloacimonetes bacterium]|nr:hypothetical protein [Candidatus Cloacimonadota bacterium]